MRRNVLTAILFSLLLSSCASGPPGERSSDAGGLIALTAILGAGIAVALH